MFSLRREIVAEKFELKVYGQAKGAKALIGHHAAPSALNYKNTTTLTPHAHVTSSQPWSPGKLQLEYNKDILLFGTWSLGERTKPCHQAP